MRFLAVPTILAALFLTTSAPADTSSKIDALLRHCHANGMFNGVVLVKKNGQTIYEKAFGVADRRDERALDLDSAFYLGSVAKQFTAMAAMILADEGKLSFDDPLSKFFPEFAEFAESVTVDHLLTHTSGIPNHFRLLGSAPDGLDNETVRKTLLDHGKLDFPPGTKFSYSNGGYVLLSMIVEKAAGKSYAEFMKEKIFDPLGMERTLVYTKARPEISNRAVGFAANGSLDDYTLFTTGAGGMYSTLRDLARWDAALYEGKLVSEATLKRAYSPALLADGSESPYGYGWSLMNAGGRRIVSHGGSLAGYRAFIGRDLENRDALILLTNHGNALNAAGITPGVLAILGGGEATLPKIPISLHLRKKIDELGIAAALALYDEIRAQRTDEFVLAERQLNTLGYEYLGSGKVAIAIAIFEKNVEVYPDSYNVYDSLAEAQMTQGLKREAIINYAKSLVRNPDNSNAIEMLSRLKSGD